MGITTSVDEVTERAWAFEAAYSPLTYVRAVQRAGAVALLLLADPNRPADVDEVLERVDGDRHRGLRRRRSARYGEVPHPETQADFAGRDAFEAVENPGKPFLLGVRWHPEEDESATVVGALVDAASR